MMIDPTSRRLDLSVSPHLHSRWTTGKVMWIVVLALLPPLAAGVLFFGTFQLLVAAVAIIVANATEAAALSLRKKPMTLSDGSATVTGLLLALTLPPNISLPFVAIGAVVAIGLGKQVFGGVGYNIFNPALVGRAFLQAAFPLAMTTYTLPSPAVDGITSATPLAYKFLEGGDTPLLALFLGNISGSIGETSKLAILIGGMILVMVGIVNWRIPVTILAGVALFSGIFWLINPATYADPLFHLMSGGLMLGAFYMATDWVSSPVTHKGMLIFGAGIALLVVFIRLFGSLPEGVMYSILIMNAFVPMINRYVRPKVFGA
ncbi:MAG: RnfABCDGE type electron transport complex subunit D [Chloroflexota bacterium]